MAGGSKTASGKGAVALFGGAANVTEGGANFRRRAECFDCSSVGGWSLTGDAEDVCAAGGFFKCSAGAWAAELVGNGVLE